LPATHIAPNRGIRNIDDCERMNSAQGDAAVRRGALDCPFRPRPCASSATLLAGDVFVNASESRLRASTRWPTSPLRMRRAIACADHDRIVDGDIRGALLENTRSS
jgi:hypothetical protein